MENKHTPLPWFKATLKFGKDGFHLSGDVPALKMHDISAELLFVSLGAEEKELLERRAFIVRACNSHYELLEALKHVMGWIDSWSPSFTEDDEWPEYNDNIRAAIAKAEGKI